MCDKKKAERYFMKYLKGRLDERKGDKRLESLDEMYQGEGLQHYVEKQHPQRRTSSFYDKIVHGSSVDAWKRFDISLSQFSFCTKMPSGEYCYGVNIADFIRGPENNALICQFYDNRAEWDTHVLPFIETIQHQLPIMSFGRYTDEKFERLHSTYNPLSVMSAKHKFRPAKGTPSPHGVKFEKMAATVAENSNLAMVRLYSRPWKFQQSQKRTEEFLAFMATSKCLVSHAYFTEHQLPVCDPFVEILCIIDVAQCLAMGKEMKPSK